MSKGYSKIRKVYLTNFMSIRKGEIEFDDRGIMKLVGYNDSGKSAIGHAIDVAMTYSHPSKQKKFIHDGARFFQVDILFDDGVTIRFEKHVTGSALYELYEGSDLVYTTKRGNVYEKVTEVPPDIAKYLGVLSTPDGHSLNYGVNTDPQLLVEWSGADNYKAISAVLKSEEISRAGAVLNKDNNTLKNQINDHHGKLNTYMGLSSSLAGVTPGLLKSVTGLASDVSDVQDVCSSLASLDERVSEHAKLVVAPTIADVDGALYEGLLDVSDLISRRSTIEDAPELQGIDYGVLESLNGLSSLVEGVASLSNTAPELKTVDYSVVSSLDSLVEALAALDAMDSKINAASETTGKLLSIQIKQEEFLKNNGYVVTRCPNCNELSIMDSAGNSVLEAAAH